jgi:CHAT domain-containing protein
MFVEFALADPESYSIVVTRHSARLQRLPGRGAIESQIEPLLKAVRSEKSHDAEARRAGEMLLDGMPELAAHTRLVVSPDGDLHQLPFELLVDASGAQLLRTHIVSYVPSGSVLAILRRRQAHAAPARAALAISAAPVMEAAVERTVAVSRPAGGSVPRGVYDLDAASLPALPSANAEAQAVGEILGSSTSAVLLGEAANEQEFKRQPLQDFQVLHFAVHGILSTKIPTRSALVLRPAGSEDGLLQAGEILTLHLRADVVTLSACDTGSGAVHGQDGVSSLVRPFLAAGAHSVVANLWAADDQFSLSLMREFYRRLAAGADVADALRSAKLRLLEQFGPQAVAKLWSGVLAYGDGASVLERPGAARQ